MKFPLDDASRNLSFLEISIFVVLFVVVIALSSPSIYLFIFEYPF